MQNPNENNTKDLIPQDRFKYQTTIKHLQTQVQTLEKKLLQIHGELKKKIIENIDLEKKQLDLRVELNGLRNILRGMYLPCDAAFEINWRHKYELLFRFLINLKAHILINKDALDLHSEVQSLFDNCNYLAVDKTAETQLVNETLKKIHNFESADHVDLQSEVEKDNVICHLKTMNQEVVMMNRNFGMKIEEMKGQISYLVDLLNGKSQNNNEKIFGLVKDLTITNASLTNQLYSAKDNVHISYISQGDYTHPVGNDSSAIHNSEQNDVKKKALLGDETVNYDIIETLKNENLKYIEKIRQDEIMLANMRTESEELKLHRQNLLIDNNYCSIEIENLKEKNRILDCIKRDYDQKEIENSKNMFYIKEQNRRIKQLEDEIKEKEIYYNKYILSDPCNNKFQVLINELNWLKERNENNMKAVAAIKNVMSECESKMHRMKVSLGIKNRKLKVKSRKIAKIENNYEYQEKELRREFENKLNDKCYEVNRISDELRMKNETIDAMLMKNEDELINLLSRERNFLVRENQRLHEMTDNQMGIKNFGGSSAEFNEMSRKNEKLTIDVERLQSELNEAIKSKDMEIEEFKSRNRELSDEILFRSIKADTEVTNNSEKIISSLNDKLKNKDLEIEKCLRLIEKLKKIKDEYVKLKKMGSIPENLSVN